MKKLIKKTVNSVRNAAIRLAATLVRATSTLPSRSSSP